MIPQAPRGAVPQDRGLGIEIEVGIENENSIGPAEAEIAIELADAVGQRTRMTKDAAAARTEVGVGKGPAADSVGCVFVAGSVVAYPSFQDRRPAGGRLPSSNRK